MLPGASTVREVWHQIVGDLTGGYDINMSEI